MMFTICRNLTAYFCLLITLTACVQPVLLVGTKKDAIEPDEVSLYFAQRPSCAYETVGYLKINGGHYSQASLFATMRQQAADVGADGVFVHYTQRLDILEYIGTASAIRCVSS